MEKFVSNLRQRSEIERRRILFVSLVVAMAIIGGLWIYSLTHRSTPKVAEDKKEEVAPFKLLGSKLKDTYKNMSASAGKAKLFKKDVQENVQNTTQEDNVVDLIPVYK